MALLEFCIVTLAGFSPLIVCEEGNDRTHLIPGGKEASWICLRAGNSLSSILDKYHMNLFTSSWIGKIVFNSIVYVYVLCLVSGTVLLFFTRNGCATSEDMLWKLDALQSFIHDLHWPDEVFAEHFAHRLKLMSADMIEAAAKRLVSNIALLWFDLNLSMLDKARWKVNWEIKDDFKG